MIGAIQKRAGTAEFKYSIQKSNGKVMFYQDKVTGLFIEEGMNTIEEEKEMAKYMGLSREEMKQEYRHILIHSNYQGAISDSVEYVLNKNQDGSLENWRLLRR